MADAGQLATTIPRLRSALHATSVRGDRADRVLTDLVGWFYVEVNLHLNETGLELKRTDLMGVLFDIHNNIGSSTLLSAHATAAHPTLAEERATDPLYIKQLDLIELPDADIEAAVASFHRARAERQGWLHRRMLGQSTLDDYDQNLWAHWHETHLDHVRDLPAGEAARVAAGKRIFAATKAFRGHLGTTPAHVHVAAGTYHQLANQRRVGWHPDYDNRLPNGGPPP